MRACFFLIAFGLLSADAAHAQTPNCAVTGYLFNADGSPAANTQLDAVSVVKSGVSTILSPIVLTTDAAGYTSFEAPRLSSVWVSGQALGLTGAGDVAILIPDGDTATLEALAPSAKSPVSGVHLDSDGGPKLSVSLQDFGINLRVEPAAAPTTVDTFNGRSGPVTLTSADISAALSFTPVDPGTVVTAVNASSAMIDDARLSTEIVRRSSTNSFLARQTFSEGVQVVGSGSVAGAALETRASAAAGSYLFSGQDRLSNYTFSVEADGRLKWGGSTRAAMDTSLYRAAPGLLKTDGSLSVGRLAFDAGANPRADLLTAITNDGRYQWTVGSVPNPFDPARQDQAMTLGWNTTADGGRLDPNEPSLAFRLENYYTQNATDRWMEAHLQYNSRTGKTFRPWAYQVNRATDIGSFMISADSFTYSAKEGKIPYVQFASDGLTLRNSATLLGETNNLPMLRQRNAANNAYITIGYVDNANRVSIGNNSTGLIAAAPYLQIGNSSGPRLANFSNVGVSILKADGTGGLIIGAETTTPAPAAAGGFKLYAKKNANGKTQLCVMFASGPEQCFATQQ